MNFDCVNDVKCIKNYKSLSQILPIIKPEEVLPIIKPEVVMDNTEPLCFFIQQIGKDRYKDASSHSMALGVLYYFLKNNLIKTTTSNYEALANEIGNRLPVSWILNFQDTVDLLYTCEPMSKTVMERAAKTNPQVTACVMGSILNIHQWVKLLET